MIYVYVISSHKNTYTIIYYYVFEETYKLLLNKQKYLFYLA